MLTRIGLTAACLLAISATAAQAQNCAPLKQIASIRMEQTADGRWLVPVKLNGQDKKLLLDTATVPSALFTEYTTEAGMALEDAKGPAPGAGAPPPPSGGRGAAAAPAAPAAAPAKVTKVQSFVLGNMGSNDGYFKVIPDTRKDRSIDAAVVGVLGTDILSRQDFDMDFGAKTLGLFSSDHCPGQVVYWQGPTVAVDFYVDMKDHMRIPVLVDGTEMSAALNTAVVPNEMSMVFGKRILRFDETEGFEKDAAADPARYTKRFKAIDLGGLAIQNPAITVVDDSKTNKINVQGSGAIRTVIMDRNIPDLKLGSVFLNKLHLYVATKERKIYVTPAVAK